MGETIRIRAAQEADIPEIQAIYALEVREETASFEEVPPDTAEMTGRWRGFVDGGYPYVVAEIGGRLAGYAYASAYRSRRAYRFAVEDSVYVARWARGRGVAGRLLERLIAECEAAGFRQMVAIIGGKDNHGSIRLHEAKGFALVGTLKGVGWKHGRWIDTVFYQRPLGPGKDAPAD